MKISVAIAAYYGEKYIEDQLRSILTQLPTDGEVVVSVDPSDDGTFDLLSRLSAADRRIVLIHGEGKGLIRNFENAIRACTGDVIFLSDQDDVWLPGKVEAVTSAFSDLDVSVVLHDASVTDGELNIIQKSFFAVHGRHDGALANWIRNSYIGCCMAFRRDICDAILPFPDNLPMHDQWIGIIGSRVGRAVYVDRPLILWRRHGNNASSTSHAGVVQMLRWRLSLALSLIGRNKIIKSARRRFKQK